MPKLRRHGGTLTRHNRLDPLARAAGPIFRYRPPGDIGLRGFSQVDRAGASTPRKRNQDTHGNLPLMTDAIAPMRLRQKPRGPSVSAHSGNGAYPNAPAPPARRSGAAAPGSVSPHEPGRPPAHCRETTAVPTAPPRSQAGMLPGGGARGVIAGLPPGSYACHARAREAVWGRDRVGTCLLRLMRHRAFPPLRRGPIGNSGSEHEPLTRSGIGP